MSKIQAVAEVTVRVSKVEPHPAAKLREIYTRVTIPIEIEARNQNLT